MNEILDITKYFEVLHNAFKSEQINIFYRNFFKLAAGFGLTYFIYKTLAVYLNRRKYNHIPGPPLRGITGFFLGNVADVVKTIKDGKIFNDYMVEMYEKYGEVYKIEVLGKIVVVVSNREAIKEALIAKNFPRVEWVYKTVGFPFNERFLGNGLVTDIDQKRWAQRRAIFNPGFHRQVLMTFIDQFNSKADMLMEKLRLSADGKTPIRLFDEINHATLDAIAQIAFGMNLDSINDKDTSFNVYITKILHTVNELYQDPFYRFKFYKYFENNESKRMIRFLREKGREKILERYHAFKSKDHLPTDILSSILQNCKSEDLDLELMIDDFVTFFIAGQETTANTLAFCFIELGLNSSLLEKVTEEVDRVLGERTQITYQDITNLKYCSCVFKEALRKYPPVPGISRSNPEEMIVNGYKIPANSWINLSSYLMGRVDKYFPNPLEFKPERFMKDQDTMDSSIENYTYFPFSLGPRNCIGQNFAQIEGIIMIAKLIQRFNFKLDKTQSLQYVQALTLRPIDGTRCFLTLRS